jgi:spermidine synthase
MKKWTAVDTAPTPDGRLISLGEHDGTWSIRVDGIELMSTWRHLSEDRIAELGCAHAAGIRKARVLIGGLGLGFTLKAALAALRPDAAVVVAEMVAGVIEWNRNPAFPLAADALADRRVSVLLRDVVDVIAEERAGFDSIVLDVDNGPAALTADSNHRLYSPDGLARTRAALRPGGCLAIWSVLSDKRFEKALARAGFAVETQRCRAHATSGGWHTIFLGRVKS